MGIVSWVKSKVASTPVLSTAQAKLNAIILGAEDFVKSEINVVDAAVVASLKVAYGQIFTPAVWASIKTVAGGSAALLANEAFSVLTDQETLTVGVMHFLAGVGKLGLDSGLVPSKIAAQMFTAGQAVVQAGVSAAVSPAQIAELKADIDKYLVQVAAPVAAPVVAPVAK